MTSWNAHDHGPNRSVQTDGNGIATMLYPKYYYRNEETYAITWHVAHPDFILLQEDREVEDDPAKIQIQRGFRVAITAKNSATGQRVKEDLYAVIGISGEAKWELKKNGTLVSGVYPKQKCYLRVMQITEGQPTLFSKMITVEPGHGSRVLFRDIELFPGTRLEGKLDASVKRPIIDGYVAGQFDIQMQPNDRKTNWQWSDKATIKEDGSFVFESLPKDVVWQMLPFCDGWVPALPKFDSVAEHFPDWAARFKEWGTQYRLPQLAKLSSDKVSVTLRMIPAASVTTTAVDPNGKPLEGVIVSMDPMQCWLSNKTTLNFLGTASRSRDALVARRLGIDHRKWIKWPEDEPFLGVSDANGVCEIKNLPPMAKSFLSTIHDEFDLPIANGNRLFEFPLKEGEQKELTLKLQAKGEGPKLGEEATDD